MPHDTWDRDRLHQPGPWVLPLAIVDLRYWDDPLACRGRKRPSVRSLAATWGWPKSVADRLIRSESWKDAGHSRDTRGTLAGQPTADEAGEVAGCGTLAGHSRDTRGTAPKGDTRARNPEPGTRNPEQQQDIPSWVPKRTPRSTRAAVLEMCTRAARAVYRSETRKASKSSAAPVLRLWVAEGHPDPAGLAEQVEHVIEAIDAGYKPLAYLADIDGTDYSRKVATVCKVSGWADKVAALEGYRPARPLTAADAWALVGQRKRTADGEPRNGSGVYWRFAPDDHTADDRIVAAVTAVGGWAVVTREHEAAFLAAWESAG